MSPPFELRSVPTSALERLERGLRDRSGGAVSPALLAKLGLGEHTAGLAPLREWPAESVRLLIEAVLAERRSTERASLELVWTGPETPSADARSTWIVLQELFRSAQHSVLVAGYAFDHGGRLFRPLHEAMEQRGVEASFFLDLEQLRKKGQPKADLASAGIDRFLRENWPFGKPRPRIYFDPRTAEIGVSLHAKCVVVDGVSALIGSANFTERGQKGNIEAGVLVHGGPLPGQLAAKWNALVAEKLVNEFEG